MMARRLSASADLAPVKKPSAGRAAAAWSGLGDLSGGDFESSADAVSADGSVVVGYGTRGTSASSREAFRWTSDGGMVGLGYLPGGFFYSVGLRRQRRRLGCRRLKRHLRLRPRSVPLDQRRRHGSELRHCSESLWRQWRRLGDRAFAIAMLYMAATSAP